MGAAVTLAPVRLTNIVTRTGTAAPISKISLSRVCTAADWDETFTNGNCKLSKHTYGAKLVANTAEVPADTPDLSLVEFIGSEHYHKTDGSMLSPQMQPLPNKLLLYVENYVDNQVLHTRMSDYTKMQASTITDYVGDCVGLDGAAQTNPILNGATSMAYPYYLFSEKAQTIAAQSNMAAGKVDFMATSVTALNLKVGDELKYTTAAGIPSVYRVSAIAAASSGKNSVTLSPALTFGTDITAVANGGVLSLRGRTTVSYADSMRVSGNIKSYDDTVVKSTTSYFTSNTGAMSPVDITDTNAYNGYDLYNVARERCVKGRFCGGRTSGQPCSGRGLCNYADGTCTCHTGYSGNACQTVEALA